MFRTVTVLLCQGTFDRCSICAKKIRLICNSVIIHCISWNVSWPIDPSQPSLNPIKCLGLRKKVQSMSYAVCLYMIPLQKKMFKHDVLSIRNFVVRCCKIQCTSEVIEHVMNKHLFFEHTHPSYTITLSSTVVLALCKKEFPFLIYVV